MPARSFIRQMLLLAVHRRIAAFGLRSGRSDEWRCVGFRDGERGDFFDCSAIDNDLQRHQDRRHSQRDSAVHH